jgi:hypothetical protein
MRTSLGSPRKGMFFTALPTLFGVLLGLAEPAGRKHTPEALSTAAVERERDALGAGFGVVIVVPNAYSVVHSL